MLKEIPKNDQKLLKEIVSLVHDSKKEVARTVNSTITLLYWQIGHKINTNILKNNRADYGQQIVATLSRELTNNFGRGFGKSNLRKMMDFASKFSDLQIVHTLSGQLTWSHLVLMITIEDDLERDFYIAMCKNENWSVRVLSDKIDSNLFYRTAISKKPEKLIKQELKDLKDNKKLTPDLVFKSPYFLEFLNLKDSYSEKSLEDAVLKEIENFILELGVGFTFIERQKRMIIDGEDFYLDLLFFHRKLKRLVVIDLKIGKFKAAYKGQMELYLNWLDQNERQKGEESPIGLILCSQGNKEQIKLMQLNDSNVRVAEYFTELPDKKILEDKLHQAIKTNKEIIENRVKA